MPSAMVGPLDHSGTEEDPATISFEIMSDGVWYSPVGE
jgi:hypothetical protein